jgi:hypothetical protein
LNYLIGKITGVLAKIKTLGLRQVRGAAPLFQIASHSSIQVHLIDISMIIQPRQTDVVQVPNNIAIQITGHSHLMA